MPRIKKILFRLTIVLIALIGVVTLATYLITSLPQFGKKPMGDHLEKIKKSPQHNGEIFENAGGIEVKMNLSKFSKMFVSYLNPPDNKTPVPPPAIMHPGAQNIGNEPDSVTLLTWFGHSAFLLEMDGKKILIDPMLGPAASPFPFMIKRFTDDLAIPMDSIPEVDFVIFSHDHYDHLDYPTILALKDRVKHFYVPLGLGSHLEYWGVESNKISEHDWWDEINADGIRLVCTPSQHFSGRSTDDGASTLWASWVIQGKKKKIFFSGDSGCFPGFKAIGEKYGPFDIALMECGQYNIMWHEIHMLPEETAQAGSDVNTKHLMPIHWGMFDLSLHAWTEPILRVKEAAKSLDLEIVTPRLGQRFSLDNPLPMESWWDKQAN
jgi:L-ascorbate metabolism protein UlaG (beta-lactamase superfamily)